MKFDRTASGILDELDDATWRMIHDKVHPFAIQWIESHVLADLPIPDAVRLAGVCIAKYLGGTVPPNYTTVVSQNSDGDFVVKVDEEAVGNLIRLGLVFGYALGLEVMNEDTFLPSLGFSSDETGSDSRGDAPESGNRNNA